MKSLIATMSLVCLVVAPSSYAATQAWSITLKTSGDPDGPWQIVPDGSGGCACRFVVTGTNGLDTTTFLWFDSTGNQIYKKVYDGGRYLSFIATVNKSTLVYSLNSDGSNDDSSFIVVSRTGPETTLDNCKIFDPDAGFAAPPYPIASDKKGFFAIRYTDKSGTVELVRFLYK